MAQPLRSTAESRPGLPNLGAPLTPLAENSLSFLVMSLSARLSRGAANYYLRRFGISMVDFRILMALGLTAGVKVGELALAADVDPAAASRCLKPLQERGLVRIEQTSSRGRAAFVHLTDSGAALEHDLRRAATAREQRFGASLSPAERETTFTLLHKLVGNVPAMNQD